MLGGVVQVAVGAGPAEGDVAAQGEHVIDAVIQIGLQLLLDSLLGVGHAGEVGHRDGLAVLLDLVEHLEVLADVGSAGAVGAGNIIGVQLVQVVQHAAFGAELFHAGVRLGREHLKRKRHAVLQDFSNVLHVYSS